MSRFLNCSEGIPGEAFVKIYKELSRHYQTAGQEDQVEFMRGYIPPGALIEDSTHLQRVSYNPDGLGSVIYVLR